MMKTLVLALALCLAGCATAHKISRVQLGMTESEVIDVMGEPQSKSATGQTIYLNYAMYETDDDAFFGKTRPYYVRLVNGRVDAYGRLGDFDSTKTPAVKLETDPDVYAELQKLADLRDSGTITEAEFQRLKARLLDQ